MATVNLMHGDCLEQLKNLGDNSVDSIVTDPPYGLAFMGKKWDYDVPSTDIWKECFRVLKPGGHLLAFAGTRTQHRMCVRIEDAGFEIRDMIAWVYGSGFPKSMELGKQIDKAAGATRKVVGDKAYKTHDIRGGNLVHSAGNHITLQETAPETDDAKEWNGWGTALKPAMEPITVARKPLGESTVAKNVLKWKTGAINIDGCRVSADAAKSKGVFGDYGSVETAQSEGQKLGRYPANLIHDGSPEVISCFPEKAGAAAPVKKGHSGKSNGIYGDYADKGDDGATFRGDEGSASRFFYCAKATSKDREEGMTGVAGSIGAKGNGLNRVCETCGVSQLKAQDCKCETKSWVNASNRKNFHPTVKPTSLMQYLCRMVTAPGGTVLDPFMGSGSTGKAAILEGYSFIGVEMSEEYLEIARQRIQAAKKQKDKELPL